MQKLFYILNLSLALCTSVSAQTDKFCLSGNTEKGYISVPPSTVYDGYRNIYGYDLNTKPGDKSFFFSVKLPEGNYKVHLTFGGSDKVSQTTVKAESRRLMLEKITTQPNETVDTCIMVNIRNKYIGATDSVRTKPREIGKLDWDNKMTLEFNGENQNVQKIEIEKVNDAVTVFLAGNSTVVNEPNEPWCGWGQMLPRFLTGNIAVANYAESGEAANSFVSSRRFAKLLSEMKSGDYLFIEFGHNDQKQKGEGKGPYTSYKSDLKYLADKAKEKGAYVVLVTSMHRRSFDKYGKIINTHGEYPDAVRLLAKEDNIPLIDLTAMSKVLYEAWGVEGSKKAFVHFPANTFPGQDKPLADNTHFNPYGGYEIAKCILQGIKENNLPIAQYIANDFRGFDPAKPDHFEDFSIPPTPFCSIIKPDGN